MRIHSSLLPTTTPRRRLAAAAGLAALAAIAAPLSGGTVAVADVCGQPDVYHFYAAATSGHGSPSGTALVTTTPQHWSVDRSVNAAMDEAAWLDQYVSSGASSSAIEGGFYSGAGTNVPWTNGLLPYYTLNDGSPEVDGGGHYLPANRSIPIRVVNGGWVQVNDWRPGFSYSVAGPQENFAQGEVNGNSTRPHSWLSNGSGEAFQAFWSPDGQHWYTWGFHNDCANSPYWITSKGKDAYVNGGYGYAN